MSEVAICEAHEKGGAPCAESATVRVHWPNRSLVMCDEHAAAAKRVADAMGFDLTRTSLIDGHPVGSP